MTANAFILANGPTIRRIKSRKPSFFGPTEISHLKRQRDLKIVKILRGKEDKRTKLINLKIEARYFLIRSFRWKV